MRKAYNIKYKALNFSELYDRIKSVAIFGHSLGETDHTYFITSSQLITIKNFGSFIIKKMATTV